MAEYIDRNDVVALATDYGEGQNVMMLIDPKLVKKIPDADVVGRDEYEKLKKENVELKIKCDDAEKRCCHAMDRNAKLRSKIDKAIEDIEDLDPITERVGLQVKQEILNILKGI